MYDYFYGQQAELFSFYRVPKVLFTDEKFSNISSDAKLLYGIMLDRMNLSAKNGWVDELGRVYIIFTIEEVKGALGCAEKKAVKLLHELENKCGLIERKRIGLSGESWATPYCSALPCLRQEHLQRAYSMHTNREEVFVWQHISLSLVT